MLKIIFIIIIIYILITHYCDDAPIEAVAEVKTIEINSAITEPKVWTFENPNPWSKVVFDKNEEYPYFFYIKIKIPSYEVYNNWKQVIPNLDFAPMPELLVIPSKDEPSALAIANLIVSNFAGQLTLKEILDKKLIQISIAKAQSHEVVQSKLKEQIMNTLYGNMNKSETNFEKDLAIKEMPIKEAPIKETPVKNLAIKDMNLKSEGFTDTFQHFSEDNNNSNEINAYDGFDYSYL